MKVEQEKPEFKPVTITLETREEAELLLRIAESKYHNYPFPSKEREILIHMSNLLSDITL